MAAGAYVAWLPRDPQILISGFREYPEAATQTYKRGTPVTLDSNGRIAAAGASPNPIYGVAGEDGQNGTAGQYLTRVYPLRANQEWQIALTNTLAQNLIGQAGGDLGVVKDATSGYWYGDTGDGGAQCRIVDYLQGPAGFAIGDTKALVFVVFHTTKLQVI